MFEKPLLAVALVHAALATDSGTVTPTLRRTTLAQRLDRLERLYHQHLHDHAGVFEHASTYTDLPDGIYSWKWSKVDGVWGSNDTVMHVMLLPDPTGDGFLQGEEPSSIADGLTAYEDRVVAEATALCAPVRASLHVTWREGDPAMVEGVCYIVELDDATGPLASMALQFDVRKPLFAPRRGGHDYMVLTEHSPTEFEAGFALTASSGETFAAKETAQIKGQGVTYPSEPGRGGFIPGGEVVQDGVATAALVFAVVGFILAAIALAMTCANQRNAAPKFATELSTTAA